MPDPSDRDLALRARRGDADAFGELVRRYQTSVFNVCCRLTGERREAEDMAQEAFIRAYERLGTFKPEMPFGPWMRRVAANVCLNRLERRAPISVSLDDERGPASGWIGRHLATLNTGNPSPLRAVGLGARPPRSLSGSIPVAALRSIADFHLGGDPQAAAQMRAALTSLYAGGDALSVIGQETLEILDALQALDPLNYQPISGLQYPASDFGLGLRQIAMLVKAEVGLEVAAMDLGGWDTHFAQGGGEGLMAGLLKELADGLAAFHADLFDHAHRLTVVAMSEFGRRAQENGSLGTDHGHGSLMLLMGGSAVGGKVHGQWPGLAEGSSSAPAILPSPPITATCSAKSASSG
jgi:RNA polymerase sigma factor (sigma-70 family)